MDFQNGLAACALSSVLLFSTCFAQKNASINMDLAKAQFIGQTAAQFKLSKSELTTILSHAKKLPEVIKHIKQPYESKPFDVYTQHFLTSKRITDGDKFWQAHSATLKKAQQQYGVDPSIIIAILGAETFYGKNEGSYSVLSALYTLSFFYPPRARFFTHQLAEFLAMCHNQHLSPYKILGSYAGAFGMPQFMPDSYRHYGVDYSNNHHIDLMHNDDDVIMSVANFLSKAGWQRNQPIASHVKSHTKTIPSRFVSAHARPKATLAQLAKYGIYPDIRATKTLNASVIALSDKQAKEYWLAFPNFHSIMRYNPSLNYAMTVYQLSEAIRKQHDKHIS